jgi:hypothetical protein
MAQSQTQRVFNVISGLWVGSYIAVGLLVVPILFSTLGDRQVAGMIAANLFKTTAYIGVALSGFLMVMANHLVRVGLKNFRIIRWILLGLLVCTLGSAFIIIPWMNAIREHALFAGIAVQDSIDAELFKRLHGISSILFVCQSVLGLLLVWRTTKNVD